jgi:hypothetical protein
MAKTPRGGKSGAIGGKRAGGGSGKEKGRGGRKPTGRYDALPPKTKTVETDCIARGPHDKSCICGGTGKIKTVK